MNHDARAQTRRIDVGAAAVRHQAPIGVHVLVIGLKQADCQMMIEPRRIVVHAAANRQARAPLVGLKIWPANPVCIDQPMSEGGEVFCRIAEDYAATERRESIVVAVGADIAYSCRRWPASHTDECQTRLARLRTY